MGQAPLDLAQVNPNLDPEFLLDYGAPQPIEPGTYGRFSVTFEPNKAGPVQSSFVIQTDGLNPSCPPPLGGGSSSVTVVLTGTGV